MISQGLGFHTQGRSQNFLKWGSNSNTELPKAGVWRHSPQPLRDFQYFNESKLILCKNSTLIIMHISVPGMKLVLGKAT